MDRKRSRGERELPWQDRKRKLQESANPLEAPERGSKVVKRQREKTSDCLVDARNRNVVGMRL